MRTNTTAQVGSRDTPCGSATSFKGYEIENLTHILQDLQYSLKTQELSKALKFLGLF